MNKNALKGKSTIVVKETKTGKIPDSVGFARTDGYIMSNEEYYRELKKNGYKVEFTDKGVFISKW
jgi:hypothetical protein